MMLSPLSAATATMDAYSQAWTVREGRADAGVLVVCDHASNHIPEEYADLGLPETDLRRHIAYDIGAAGVAEELARRLGAPAVLAGFSRLLIDPNRGLDDPTLIMRIADGTVVPGNATVDARERARRIARFWRPYDEAIARQIEAMRIASGRAPVLISVHTFTPTWKGVPRPWHAGVLFNPARAGFARRLLTALREKAPELVIAANRPYRGDLPGDTMDRHGVGKGIAHALVEIRQDLVAGAAGERAWAARIAEAVRSLLDDPLGGHAKSPSGVPAESADSAA